MCGERSNTVKIINKMNLGDECSTGRKPGGIHVLDVPSGCRAFTGGFNMVIIATPPSTVRVVRGPCDIAVSEIKD